MKTSLICTAAMLLTGFANVANAHVLPWRAGEARQVGWGHCAKGPCMKRTDWSPSKPHRHDGRKIGFDRVVPPSRRLHVW